MLLQAHAHYVVIFCSGMLRHGCVHAGYSLSTYVSGADGCRLSILVASV